jgi:hypothetical protein
MNTNYTSDNNVHLQYAPSEQRSMSELKLTEQQQHAQLLLLDDHNVTMENLRKVMASIMNTKLEQEETLNVIRTKLGTSRHKIDDVIRRAREKFMEMKVEERKMTRMKRRSGIVDGGLAISNQMIQGNGVLIEKDC